MMRPRSATGIIQAKVERLQWFCLSSSVVDEGRSLAQMIAAHVSPRKAFDYGEELGRCQNSAVLNLRPDKYVVELDLERAGRQKRILKRIRQEERHQTGVQFVVEYPGLNRRRHELIEEARPAVHQHHDDEDYLADAQELKKKIC